MLAGCILADILSFPRVSFELFSLLGQLIYQSGMKRVCSSPEMYGSLSSLHHPTIHKVTPRGSPSNPSPSKRLHTHSSSLDRVPSGATVATFGKSAAL
ncbi:MAG: hypothetical protein FRX49_09234 [Trebouxia sp. A1-2]|nr:MAG: hypothetical protein FRX49_09234 [Trebouxia sp. A1-2]